MGTAQTSWDPVDGAAWIDVWAEKNGTFLIQESIGDPVMPNNATAMVAVSVGAKQVGAVLDPLHGLTSGDVAENMSAITQYLVPETDELAIHGFGGRDTPAGFACREQIKNYLESVWAGAPRITIPSGCVEGSCDFSGE